MPTAFERRDSVTKQPGSPSHTRRASIKVLNRNVDKVVLGNLLFDSWYFSPYPEAVIFGSDHHPHKVVQNGEYKNGEPVKLDAPWVSTLHVCPYCFSYTKDMSDYAQHMHLHAKEAAEDPDNWLPVPKSAQIVYEADGHTVWDVDGSKEKLYCQNLSLFGKLFLEQKSVFFDTSGFHYFVLTYSKPTSSTDSPTSSKGRGRRRSSTAKRSDLGLTTQVLGFFSKENLSWDANNLACILVFPPYQHRNLGQLLMAVSYKLSGWEWEDSVIGGPEKPLSAMGRKSYLRFWSERLARFFMSQTADADGKKVFDGARKKRVKFAKEEMTIEEIGERTGMLPEDVIAALSEMGICEATPLRKKKKVDDQQPVSHSDDPLPTAMLVKRSDILDWVRKNDVDLLNSVKEEGFRGEWAMSDTDEEDGSMDSDASG